MNHVREAMLRAAAEVLADRGLEATTMQHIAEEAGYTVPSLYAYFKGRQDLIDALLIRLDELMERTFTDSMPDGLSFRQKLELLVHRQLRFGEEWRAAYVVSFAAKRSRPSTRNAPHQEDLYQALVVAWLQRHGGADDLGGYAEETFACVLHGMLTAVFQRWLATGLPERLADESAVIVRILLYGVAGRDVGRGAGVAAADGATAAKLSSRL